MGMGYCNAILPALCNMSSEHASEPTCEVKMLLQGLVNVKQSHAAPIPSPACSQQVLVVAHLLLRKGMVPWIHHEPCRYGSMPDF